MSSTFAVILAAGQGTRMKSNTHKVLHPIGGKPMVEHIVSTMEHIGIDDIIVVVGHGAESVKRHLGDRVRYALQKEQLGTAHAVYQTKAYLEGRAGRTLVINGDNPLITADTFEQFLAHFADEGVSASVLTAVVDNPFGYGRVLRSPDGDVERIVEEKDATELERAEREINTGTFCFWNADLFAALEKVDNDNAQGEYYLPEALAVLRAEGKRVSAFRVRDASETVGINDRVQLAEAEAVLRQRILARHMKSGVTVVDPDNTYIDADVAIGRDTVILPGTTLRGKTVIGEDCVIGPQAHIIDSRIASRVTVELSTIKESAVEADTSIGPYAYLRPDSTVANNVKIGNFVEIKNSAIGAGTKVPHLSYIGDAELGRDVNIGCGAITVNYDGEQKWRTVVGDRAFIGCNVNLIAPVHIGEDTYVAAGSTVTDDVPAEAFAIARERQTTKENYVHKLKKKDRGTAE